ncbi:hypothetical protein ACHQM5_000602 [Ranunculus cassubicifolius]
MAPTPTPPSKPHHRPFTTPSRTTPNSKYRLTFNSTKNPNPTPIPKESPSINHPVEVITRIRNYPITKDPNPISALHISSDRCNIRVNTEIRYKDFTLDGVSVTEDEDLDGFYKKFVKSRIYWCEIGGEMYYNDVL